MPCNSDGYEDTGRTQREELDKVTRLLCELCSTVANHHPRIEVTSELAIWYRDHLEQDRRRGEIAVIENHHKKAIAEARAVALAKLTPEEQKLLRISP